MAFAMKALAGAVLFCLCLTTVISAVPAAAADRVRSVADASVRPVMNRYRIPGMAVGLTIGREVYIFNYGVTSRQSRIPVTNRTLFEVGSISKTITATLTSYAAANGDLSLSDSVDKFIPELRGSKFGEVRLLNLATHTPGGLPLQVPDNVTNDTQLLEYLKKWQPAYAPGTVRTYSNVSIGFLGLIAAKSMHLNYAALVEQRLFPALGMNSSYINVPRHMWTDYAQGYTATDAPIRMRDAVLSEEAYGVRTTAADLVRFLQDNMQLVKLNAKLQRSLIETHAGYFKTDGMTQDLIWEQYRYPVQLSTLLKGNSPAMAFQPQEVTKIQPAEPPRSDVWLNKTGSTNGFGAYVAFVPKQEIGIVILANKTYPIEQRVRLAYRIVTQLTAKAAH